MERLKVKKGSDLDHGGSVADSLSGSTSTKEEQLAQLDIVQLLLRPSERAILATDCRFMKRQSNGTALFKKRIFALVVSNAHPDEAAVFLIKRRSQTVHVIDRLMQIQSDFATAIIPSTDHQTDFTIRLHSNRHEMTLRFIKLDGMQSVLAELRQYQTLAQTHTKQLAHEWLQFYVDKKSGVFAVPAEISSQISRFSEMAISQMSSTFSPTGNERNPFLARANHGVAIQPIALSTSEAMLHTIKESWINDQLKKRENEFTDYKSLKVMAGTWNVNGKLVAESLEDWFHLKKCVESLPDLIVVGFQEIDLSAEAFLLNESNREEFWTIAIENGFGKLAKEKYTKLISKQLVGMLMYVYIRKDHLPHVGSVTADSAGCGIMGMMGNKGGVAVRLKLYDSWLCFVNSHLAADSKEVERRNQDYGEICRRIGFTGVYSTIRGEPFPRVYKIWQSDHLIWLGDLNYRINLAEDQAKKILSSCGTDYDQLLVFDQLRLEQKEGNAFVEFEEHPILFPPSYKYDPGTDTFDTSEKKRTPSWCDRILWRRGDRIKCLEYDSVMALKISDHKPVRGLYQLDLKVISHQKRADVHQSILRELDKFENESMPVATIDHNALHFQDVEYLQPQCQVITLKNTGKVISQFRFVPKLDEQNHSKPWLWINPPMGLLLPGESATIGFTILVDNDTAPPLNMGNEHLEDIIILHLENGKDYFISISGTYLPTSFGLSLDTLVRMPDPIQKMAQTNFKSLAQSKPCFGVPKELWRMIDYLFQNGMNCEDLFLCSGDPALILAIRRNLDNGEPFENPEQLAQLSLDSVSESGHDRRAQYIHAMAECSIRFLDALADAVVPSGTFYQRCLDASQNFLLAKQAITSLPTVHYETFIYLISFLREYVQKRANQNVVRERLAVVFGAVLLRSPKSVSDKYQDILARKKTSFISMFLDPAEADP